MVSMIREYDDSEIISQNPDVRAKSGIAGRILALILGFIVLACLSLAVWQAQILGWPAFALLFGVAVSALFAIFAMRASRQSLAIDYDDDFDSQGPLLKAFLHSPEAILLTRNGKPWKANDRYMHIANTMGAVGISDGPPPVDRLFQSHEKDTASAIFRLYHLRSDRGTAEEFINTLGPDGLLRRYHIQVAGLGEAQLWQVKDVTGDHGGADATLTSAPIGLLSVNGEGKVIATNTVLDRWLGVENSVRPEFIREFIEDYNAVLDVPKTPGRVIRADTRLITNKGIVTPTVMSATWQELDSGEMIASIALYGHSSLGSGIAPLSPPKPLPTSRSHAGSEPGVGLDSVGFDLSPLAMVKLTGNTIATAQIAAVNTAFCLLSPDTQWQDMSFVDIFTKTDDGLFNEISAQDPVNASLKGEPPVPVQVYATIDGTDARVFWIYMVDNSAQKGLEDQLVQSQKMQAIGQLAAGVAHDFNNLLTTIRLNTDELLGRHPVGDPSYKELHAINNTVNRAAALVKKLLAFSRKQTLRMEQLDITDTLSDLTVNLQQSLGERIKLTVKHGRGLPPIRADKTQLDQVLLNLCVNARDAMEDQGGGQITITTSKASRSDLDPREARETKGDDFVLMSFSDTGSGMTDAVKSKIFEPFFTTKEQGKGTGLGLATVYGIVQQTGGVLGVDSELGVGTTFRIFLPVAEIDPNAPEVTPAKPVKRAPPKPVDLAGQGTILFVEDEESVRVIAAKTLRKRGYTVIEAEDGEEAYEILEDGEHTFDLMISDVVMPSMDGPTLLKKGRHMLGEARIVFISGYAEEEFSELLSEEPDVTFLPKPFTLAQLAEKVKAEIGEIV